ncbi:oligosaccharide flippase family protein [Pacificimonas flava]|uniref:Polysaccharide biosynthesis protein n=1 Tax=Pacificimonas flava TaxID=1234595 RepID=M2T531_9SPHN|nr:oligosaccharide flippase family protein [Pacificimonas flava]EMD81594.1 Polysaccharide biosynthesis protein [Pacificimonas flava]MBB5281853.1 O-antigen/teichoic acid export membrane protein [Pacificimonas flava]
MAKLRLLRLAAFQQAATFGIVFITSLIIARVLTPSEIGTFSIAMASVVIADVIKAAGVSNYFILADEIDKTRVQEANGLVGALSLTLGVVIYSSRNLIADFYGAPRIADILLVVAISYPLIPYQAIPNALLVRELKVGTTGILAIGSQVINSGTAIVLALNGYGSMSLVWGMFASSITLVVTYRFLEIPHMSYRFRLSNWKAVWSISAWTMASSLLNNVGARSNELVIGRTLGISSAAFFERSLTLPRLLWANLSRPILGVLAPLTSDEIRKGSYKESDTLFRMQAFSALFCPVLFALATQSGPVIRLMYGSQWTAAIEPAFWVCISSALVGHFVTLNSVLIAQGRLKEFFYINLSEQVAKVGVFVVFANTDIIIIARAMLLVSLVYISAYLWIGKKIGMFRVFSVLRALVPVQIVSAVTLGAGMIMEYLFQDGGVSDVLQLLIAAVGFGVVWSIAVRLLMPRVFSLVLHAAFFIRRKT